MEEEGQLACPSLAAVAGRVLLPSAVARPSAVEEAAVPKVVAKAVAKAKAKVKAVGAGTASLVRNAHGKIATSTIPTVAVVADLPLVAAVAVVAALPLAVEAAAALAAVKQEAARDLVAAVLPLAAAAAAAAAAVAAVAVAAREAGRWWRPRSRRT